MSLLNWIFDAYQHHKIDQVTQESARLREEVAAIRATGGGIDAGRLESALGELALAVRTLQRIFVEKGLCTQSEYLAKLRAVDLEDGIQDGRSPIG